MSIVIKERQSTISWRDIAYWAPIVVIIALFLIPAVIYLQDLSDWTFQGWLLSKYIQGEPITQYALKLYPVPNTLVTVSIGLLALILPIFWAEKILIAIVLSGWALLIYRLCKQQQQLDIARAWLGFLVLALASNFWSGYLNFNISALLWCTFLYRDTNKPAGIGAVIAFSIALFFCHAITYALFAVFILCKYSWRRVLGLIPSLVLLAAYLIGRYWLAGNAENIELVDPIHGAGLGKWLAYKIYTVLKLGPFQNYLLRDGQSYFEAHGGVYWLLVSLSVVVTAYLIVQLVFAQISRWPTLGREKLFWLGVPLAFLLPAELAGVVNPAERVLFLYLVYAFVHWARVAVVNVYIRRVSGALALLFLCYNIAVLTTINFLGRDRIGVAGNIENPNAVFGSTRLPYFSHALFAHSEKLDQIAGNSQDAIIFSSGIWLRTESR